MWEICGPLGVYLRSDASPIALAAVAQRRGEKEAPTAKEALYVKGLPSSIAEEPTGRPPSRALRRHRHHRRRRQTPPPFRDAKVGVAADCVVAPACCHAIIAVSAAIAAVVIDPRASRPRSSAGVRRLRAARTLVGRFSEHFGNTGSAALLLREGGRRRSPTLPRCEGANSSCDMFVNFTLGSYVQTCRGELSVAIAPRFFFPRAHHQHTHTPQNLW